MNGHADSADRADRKRTYQRLALRNRLVAVLRIGVPAFGLVVLVGLVGQIYLSNMGKRFGVGAITMSREAINVAAPEYAGILDNGTLYHVSAASAQAALDASDLIDLTDATLLLTRPNGVTMQASARRAQLDTTNELVIIEGTTHVVESTGTTSVLNDSVFDWQKQILTSKGAVDVAYADGTHLVAQGLVYQAKSMVWTFSGATVTLKQTPGATKQ